MKQSNATKCLFVIYEISTDIFEIQIDVLILFNLMSGPACLYLYIVIKLKWLHISLLFSGLQVKTKKTLMSSFENYCCRCGNCCSLLKCMKETFSQRGSSKICARYDYEFNGSLLQLSDPKGRIWEHTGSKYWLFCGLLLCVILLHKSSYQPRCAVTYFH